jgi:thioredoxin 1
MNQDDSPRHVSDASFRRLVLDSETPVLVDFWAPWCEPCRMIAPVVESLAADYGGRLAVAKLNIDDNPDTPQKYQVMGIPTLILFKGGQPVERFVGYIPKEDLKRLVDALL